MIAALFLAAQVAAFPAEAQHFVAQTEEGFKAVRAIPSVPARGQACADLIARAFDQEAVSRRAAQRYWEGASQTLRTEIRTTLTARMVKGCDELAARAFAGKGEIRRVRVSGTGLSVTVQYRDPGGRSAVFIWRLAPGGPFGLHATDLTVDGRGTVAALQRDLEGALSSHGGNMRAALIELGDSNGP